jgi:hypothetical protein
MGNMMSAVARRTVAVVMISVALTLFAELCDAQAAEQIGGRPPKGVETKNCGISHVFAHLQAIKTNKACIKGCRGVGKCPPDWYPSKKDTCSAECGKVFEPFWDQVCHRHTTSLVWVWLHVCLSYMAQCGVVESVGLLLPSAAIC